MALRRNSRPYPFRSFAGVEPTTEQLREELEQVYRYLEEGISGIEFEHIGGSFTSDQRIELENVVSSIVGVGETAFVSRLDTIEAIVKNPRTGVVASWARITTQETVQATVNTAFAQRIDTVQATVGNASASIIEERTARISADGTIEANLTIEVAARIVGDSELSASVTAESVARANADGNLSAKYTLTVQAGDVVTGMNITSASGPGVNISEVTFRADRFKIYNGTNGVTMFDINGSNVELAGTLVVSTAGRVFIGNGFYNDAATPFYVDDLGQFSLSNKLTWNGSTLAINGNLTSTSGTVGGFTLSSNEFSATNISMDSSSPHFRIGNSSAERASMEIVSGRARFAAYNGAGALRAVLQGDDGISGGGFCTISDGFGNIAVALDAGGIRVKSGSAGFPGFCFDSDADTGLRLNSAGDMRAVTSGVDRLVVRDAAIVCLVPLKLDNSFVGGAPVATGFVTIQDLTGTTYKVLVGV